MVTGGTTTVVWDLWARSFVGKLKGRWGRQRGEDETLESSGGNLAVHNTARENIVDDEQSRGSIMLPRAAIGMVQLPTNGSNMHQGEQSGESERDRSNERSIPEAVRRVSRGLPVKVGVAVVVAFLGTL
jgi:hypothetical protein